MAPSFSTEGWSEAERDLLREIARASIEHGIYHQRSLEVDPAAYPASLCNPRACFVTLHLERQLRGCIGTLEPVRPLIQDVAENAYAAAFRDPRFPPMRQGDFATIEIHISVLGIPEPLAATTEEALLACLRPGIDGLILDWDGRRATFLPSVWSQLPKPVDFLYHLKRKAGLPGDFWSPKLRCFRYVTESF